MGKERKNVTKSKKNKEKDKKRWKKFCVSKTQRKKSVSNRRAIRHSSTRRFAASRRVARELATIRSEREESGG